MLRQSPLRQISHVRKMGEATQYSVVRILNPLNAQTLSRKENLLLNPMQGQKTNSVIVNRKDRYRKKLINLRTKRITAGLFALSLSLSTLKSVSLSVLLECLLNSSLTALNSVLGKTFHAEETYYEFVVLERRHV